MNCSRRSVSKTIFLLAVMFVAGFSSVAFADDQGSLLFVQSRDIRRCLERARLSGLPVIARLSSGLLLSGTGMNRWAFEREGMNVKVLESGVGKYLYRVFSERRIDISAAQAYGTVLIDDVNCVIIARDTKLAGSVQIDHDTWLAPLNHMPKSYRMPADVKLRSIQYDPFVAGLVAEVDTARIREWIQRLQAFRTRYSLSANRFAVADTIRNQFLGIIQGTMG